MLKGILFIALIIITFDIGMYFVDKNKEQLRSEKEFKAENYIEEDAGQGLQEQVEPDEVIQTLIDFSLPEDVLLDQTSNPEFGEEDKLKGFMDSAGTERKRVSVKGKPIVSFDKEINEKPVLEGVDVGVTIKID